MNDIIEKIGSVGIVPVITLNHPEDAVPLARALCQGGLPAAEMTFRVAGAAASIRSIREAVPEMLVGAGTVLTKEQADEAIAAGAQFIVSPGLNPAVVTHCLERGVTVLPGVNAPSDIERALGLGLEVVKFFPAESSGGIHMIKALSAPYNMVKFMPTGGINPANLNHYLAFDKIVACGGSWMVKEELIEAGRFDEITRLTREAVNHMLGFELAHVGLNAQNADEASSIAGEFDKRLNLMMSETPISFFAGQLIEVMKEPLRGLHGHIGFKTNHMSRTVGYLKQQGFTFDESTAQYDDSGKLKFIYVKEQIGGFAFHFIQK